MGKRCSVLAPSVKLQYREKQLPVPNVPLQKGKSSAIPKFHFQQDTSVGLLSYGKILLWKGKRLSVVATKTSILNTLKKTRHLTDHSGNVLATVAMCFHSYSKTGEIINHKLRNYFCIRNTCLNNKSNQKYLQACCLFPTGNSLKGSTYI